MKRNFALIFACALVGVLAATVQVLSKPAQTLQPLSALVDGKTDIASLPPGSIVLTMKDGAQITTPFRLGEDPAAVGGVSLQLPKGMGTKERTGAVKLEANAPEPGNYFAWARVLWRDECSNSIFLTVGDSSKKLVGEDVLYNAWHWVPAGSFKLSQGSNAVALLERENGIALDELLFTREEKYTPVGMINTLGEKRGIRRFADDFSRSPGHGMEGWDLVSGKWDIAFSFDPNRIPNQYALNGMCTPDAAPAPDKTLSAEPAKGSGIGMALVKAAPWYGCRVDFSFFPIEDGKYGAVLDRSLDGKEALLVTFHLADKHAELFAEGSGLHATAELGNTVRLKQWHHVVIERWAWILRVYVDDQQVLSNYNAVPRAGAVGFFVESGKATFDDLELEEIAWQADNNAEQSISWQSPAGAQWFRETDDQSQPPVKKLTGRAGTLSTKLGDLPLEEVVLEEIAQPKGKIQLTAEGMTPETMDHVTVLRRAYNEKTPAGKSLTLNVSGEEAQVRRVAVRYGERAHPKYSIGPYNFAESEIEDPSDYLDFTPEEYKKMQESPEANKLRRQAKFKPLVGYGGEAESPWILERGSWNVNNGVLSARGPMASVRHAEEATSDVDVHLRVRLNDPTSMAEVELYAMPDPGLRVQILGEKAVTPKQFANPAIAIKTGAGIEFHDLAIRTEGHHAWVTFDKEPVREVDFKKGDGGRLFLKVPSGHVDFDDILCEYPKRTEHGAIYSFQRRENDWWREGPWIDHGGISCVLASSWVSLECPHGEGMLWNKRPVASNALIAFDVEENTEWYGWDRYPSHVHHPYDNIRAEFAGAAGAYRLVVNAEQHTATILYRNGVEVARVRHDGNFPMRFVGGHAPFMPRRSRIALVKRGDLIRGIVNGKEVLSFKDSAPLEVNRAGIGGNETYINFSHIELRDIEVEAPKIEEGKK